MSDAGIVYIVSVTIVIMSQKALYAGIPQIHSIPKKIKILATILSFIIGYGIIGHMIVFKLNPLDAVIQTVSTLAMHYETAPTAIGESFQISLILVGVIAFWWVLWTSFDLTLEGKFKEYFSEVKEMSDLSNMRDHYIICGAGRVGIHTAKLLALEKKPFVLIDVHDGDIENAKKKGFHVMRGDPIEEETLMSCGLTRAKALIAVMAETEKNILVTLIAKQFNPKINVYARTEKEELINTLKKVGADHVIMPEAAGAIDISKAINRDEKEYAEMQNIKAKIRS